MNRHVFALGCVCVCDLMYPDIISAFLLGHLAICLVLSAWKFFFRISGMWWSCCRGHFLPHLPAIQTVTNNFRYAFQLYHNKSNLKRIRLRLVCAYCHFFSPFFILSPSSCCVQLFFVFNAVTDFTSLLCLFQFQFSWGFPVQTFCHSLFYFLVCVFFFTVWLNSACVFFHVFFSLLSQAYPFSLYITLSRSKFSLIREYHSFSVYVSLRCF